MSMLKDMNQDQGQKNLTATLQGYLRSLPQRAHEEISASYDESRLQPNLMEGIMNGMQKSLTVQQYAAGVVATRHGF